MSDYPHWWGELWAFLVMSCPLAPAEASAPAAYWRWVRNFGRDTVSTAAQHACEESAPYFPSAALILKKCREVAARGTVSQQLRLGESAGPSTGDYAERERTASAAVISATKWALQHGRLDILARSGGGPDALTRLAKEAGWAPDERGEDLPTTEGGGK